MKRSHVKVHNDIVAHEIKLHAKANVRAPRYRRKRRTLVENGFCEHIEDGIFQKRTPKARRTDLFDAPRVPDLSKSVVDLIPSAVWAGSLNLLEVPHEENAGIMPVERAGASVSALREIIVDLEESFQAVAGDHCIVLDAEDILSIDVFNGGIIESGDEVGVLLIPCSLVDESPAGGSYGNDNETDGSVLLLPFRKLSLGKFVIEGIVAVCDPEKMNLVFGVVQPIESAKIPSHRIPSPSHKSQKGNFLHQNLSYSFSFTIAN